MSRTSQRIPLGRWQRGQVLQLREPICCVREGWFVFLEHNGVKFKVCRLGENDSGDLCQTDETHEVHVDFAENFMPARGVGRI